MNFWIKSPVMFLIKRFVMQVHGYMRFWGLTLVFGFFLIFITRVCDFWFETRHFHGKGTNPVCSIFVWGSPTPPSLYLMSAFLKMELEVYVSRYSTETSQVLLLNYLQRRSKLTRQTSLLLTSVSNKATEETATNYISGQNFKRWEQKNPRGLISFFFFSILMPVKSWQICL